MNTAYPTNRTGRRYAGEKLIKFKHACQVYALENKREIQAIADYLKEEIKNEDSWIQVSAYIERPHNKIWTKKKTLHKQSDASNRIKALHDSLADMLNIDDHYFATGPTRFVVGSQEKVTIVLTTLKIESIEQATGE